MQQRCRSRQPARRFLSGAATHPQRAWPDAAARPARGTADFTDHLQIDERFNAVTDRSQQLPTVGDWVYLQRGPYP